MTCYDYSQGRLTNIGYQFAAQPILPDNSVVIQRTPFTVWETNEWPLFFKACENAAQELRQQEFIFIDASWDPVSLNNDDLIVNLNRVREIFSKSKVCMLSARAQHYYDNIPGIVYLPLFLMVNYHDLVERPRAGRIGCLNRRNAFHRVWLMHHLLEQKLIDKQRDVYSVAFTSVHSDTYYDHPCWDWFNQAQRQWPARIETHPDNFPNDYTINHPAWHTGIAIITETECGDNTLICEKTAKGFLSKSCFSVYMSEAGYRVLEELGFRPRFFAEHAEYNNIEPILKICRDITTESQALEYRHQFIEQISHNFDWFAYKQGPFQSRPWWPRYRPKLQQALQTL